MRISTDEAQNSSFKIFIYGHEDVNFELSDIYLSKQPNCLHKTINCHFTSTKYCLLQTRSTDRNEHSKCL